MDKTVLDDLKTQIAARRVVFVVGSGVSVAATGNAPASSWTGLLKLGIRRCMDLDSSLDRRWEERTLEDVESGRLEDLLSAATKVRSILQRNREWPRWLADTVGALRASQFELLDALRDMDAPILTTNYDGLLEHHLQRRPITWQDKSAQLAFARLESSETVLHLHGFWDKPDSVVLDGSDYARVVGADVAQDSLRMMAGAQSLVFVGCGDGLADPNFEQFIEWVGTVLTDARHRFFRLERRADVLRRQDWHLARKDRVRVIPYGENYDDLPAFLRTLLPALTPSSSMTDSADCGPERSAIRRPVLTTGEYVRLQKMGREAVSRLTSLGTRLEWNSIAALGEELSQTLEQHLYRVAITGRSRAGKSSLVNALVGRSLCPVERFLTTAIPIIIGPGEKESATIIFADSDKPSVLFDGPVTADMLAPYADQQHNDGNRKGVDRIEVRLGDQVLDLGVEYVDIPGFDDPTGRVWQATHDVIDRSHALVLVMDVSPHLSGGFVVDKATIDLIARAHARSCPVLVVCNKADLLTRIQREQISAHLRHQFVAHGVTGAVKHPPFFVSANEAVAARRRGEAHPPSFAAFEEALWMQLWSAENVGLRRLSRVFDALRVAGEEVSVLIAARDAQGPDRDRLEEAIAKCRADERRILATLQRKARAIADQGDTAAFDARAEHLSTIDTHVKSLPATNELPTISATIEALHDQFVIRCRSVVEDTSMLLSAAAEQSERAAARSLAGLRAQAGVSTRVVQARAVIEALDGWGNAVALPGTGAGKRRLKVGAAGSTAALSVLTTVGGPVGFFLGIGVGFAVSSIVDHFTERAVSRSDLLAKVTTHAEREFEKFRGSLKQSVDAASSQLTARVRQQMRPFLDDLEKRLASIREVTSDERSLHQEMHEAVDTALKALVAVFGPAVEGDRARPPAA